MSDHLDDVESAFENMEVEMKSTLAAARDLAVDLGKLGADWARYGLSVGKQSVQASADSLVEVAGALRKLAARMKDA
ncbi:MAG TPA: hypothetical protein VGH63_04365 [Polyangia bacterium]